MAFVTANKLKMEIESRKDTLRGRSIAFFNKNPETFLTTTLVGNNIVNVIYATLMAIFLADPIRLIYESLFNTEPLLSTVLLIQTIIASIIILLFGEILAKAIFRAQADFLVNIVAMPLRVTNSILWPLVVIADKSAGFLVRLLKIDSNEDTKPYRRQDMAIIFRELSESGGSKEIDQDDTELLQNVLELSNKRVRETMVPRTEIVAIERSATVEELNTAFIESGYSKIPVYRDTIDDVIGVVFAYDMFSYPKSIAEITRPVKLIPSSKKSKDLLSDFRQSNISVAIIIDEYGGTAGMVTIEDLIEEVVGDIQDEYDKDDEIMKKLSQNVYLISGSVELDELTDAYPEIELIETEGDFETVAGYIIHHTGRIPKVNEEIQIYGNIFIITKATQSKLETVKLIIQSGD